MKTPTLDDVLDAFAMEDSYDKETLERYILRYPQFSTDIVDLSRQLDRPVKVDVSPLPAQVLGLIDTAWRAHVAVRPAAANDPLAALDLAKSRQLARALGIPRQVITAFNERRVVVASVPKKFLAQFAASIDSTVDSLVAALSQQWSQPARSYRADEKPVPAERVSFEQLLIDADVPVEKRVALLTERE